MYSFGELKKNLKKDYTGFKTLKVAVMGDTSTQFLVQALHGYAYHYKLKLELFEADFDQVERQVFDSGSELYEFAPQIVIVLKSTEKLQGKYYKFADKEHFADDQLATLENIYNTLTAQIPCKVIYYNLPEINDRVFGNYASKVPSSFIYQLRKLNFELMNLAQRAKDLYICDISTLQNQLGRDTIFSSNIYINTDAVHNLDFVPHIAKNTLDIIVSLQGRSVKCVILDLDNTMWGGIIGDDGLENIHIGSLGIGKAFSEFQLWLKALKERGIILAVCSKNTDAVAREVFLNHPDMVLRLEDIAVFVANWENKADNIRYIQSVLNIGFDSMVFLDDNPFERNLVRTNIPEVIVPELPEDPAEYVSYLYTQNLFETVAYSAEDTKRTEHYQREAERVTAQQGFTDERAFLASLDMVSDVQPFNKFNTPRVAQLSQRSNQFNLRTIRYTEADIERLGADRNYLTFTFTLEDKYGDNGLICVIILQKEDEQTLFIDTWLMSCRVLKRGMEAFVLNTLVQAAKDNGYKYLKGEYLPTSKNGMVADHYKNLGFSQEDSHWILDVATYQPKEVFIITKQLTHE